MLGKPVIDNYWQTGRLAVLTLLPGLDMEPVRLGSPGLPNLGYHLRVISEVTGGTRRPAKGVMIQPPLPPGCMTTVWGDDQRFVDSSSPLAAALQLAGLGDPRPGRLHFVLGRTDDVINVAGHRLGTREIEESVSSHPAVAEAAVIGVHDEVKGQVPIVFATLKRIGGADPGETAEQMQKVVVEQLGGVARPARIYVVGVKDARASCGVRCRRSPSTATRATCRRWTILPRWRRSGARWRTGRRREAEHCGTKRDGAFARRPCVFRRGNKVDQPLGLSDCTLRKVWSPIVATWCA